MYFSGAIIPGMNDFIPRIYTGFRRISMSGHPHNKKCMSLHTARLTLRFYGVSSKYAPLLNIPALSISVLKRWRNSA